MIFAVDVVGNCSTQGYIFCSWGDREEEAARDGEVEDLREGDTGFGGEEAGLGIERDQAVHSGGEQEVAVFEEADVAVASAHAYREGSVVEACGDGGKVALPVEGEDLGVVGGVAAPGFEGRLACQLLVRGGKIELWRCR
jgi:hypothetical protein